MVGKLPWRAGSTRVTLRKGRETVPEDQQWSEDYTGGPGVVGKPTWRSGSGLEALLEGREWSGGLPGEPGVVGRPYRRSESSREALPGVQE